MNPERNDLMSVGVPSLSRVPEETRSKTTILAADTMPDPELRARLDELAALPWVEAVLALPDLHQKSKAEIPSSLAVTTLDAIVPEFSSVAINDGMGVVLTDLEARDVTPDRALAFFRHMNGHAARHVLDRNPYSLSGAQKRRAALEGGPAGAEFYGHPGALADRMEWSGRVQVPEGGDPWGSLVPALLKTTALGRCEMGLNFGGNHFLEMQVVDHATDPARAQAWGLAPNRVAVMYHLGPGPFGSILLHHFSRRKSLRGPRAPIYFLSKLLHHYASGRRPGSAARRWQLHFRENGWTPFAPASEEGLALRQAIAMATNFGFVYRMATIAAIRDALAAAFESRVGLELLCDVAHNSVVEEPWGDGTAWVARHNSCRVAPRAPAIVAGDCDVPSYIGCGAIDPPPGLHSYDHGAGNIIAGWRASGRLQATYRTTQRVRLERGRGGRVRGRDPVPVRTAAPIEQLMGSLERHGIVHPVARLRPIATLKN
jgi:tRNA-splicing ligase RtcB